MEYNRVQQNIIDSKESRILVEAGPGTGKTHLLIGAARKYIEENPKDNIALITFTNKAAEEMGNRLGYRTCFIGTIHKFAMDELKKVGNKHKIKLQIMGESQVSQLLETLAIKAGNSKTAAQKLTKNVLWINRDYTTARKFLGNRDRTQALKLIKTYEAYKEEKGLYDGTDTPKYLLNLLEMTGESLGYDKIFIDEAQDLDPYQFKLICNYATNIFAIGDPRQSIYMFRGASSSVFDKFVKEEYFELYNLKHNYRSYQEILDLSGADIVAMRGKGGKTYTNLEQIIKNSPMFLCRKNSTVDAIKKHYPDVMTIHSAKGLEFDNVVLVYGNKTLQDVLSIEDEEDKNIAFVGMTRARNNLAIVPYRDVEKYFQINKTSPASNWRINKEKEKEGNILGGK